MGVSHGVHKEEPQEWSSSVNSVEEEWWKDYAFRAWNEEDERGRNIKEEEMRHIIRLKEVVENKEIISRFE